MRARIDCHRSRRPPTWITVEAPRDPASALLAATTRVVLLDCLTLLAANAFLATGGDNFEAARTAVQAESVSLIKASEQRDGQLIIVTNEVGFGIVPDNESGRWFRDLLGEVNCVMAERAEQVTLVMAGCHVPLKRPSHD